MGSVAPRVRPAVLVVEDEPLLRIAAADMVEQAGFEPIEAGDAAEALRILQRRPDIRIVFIDIVLPEGLDGLELAEAIRHDNEPIDIILTSGYRERAVIRLPERAVFFRKPYREEEIVAQMRRMVSDAPDLAGARGRTDAPGADGVPVG